MIKLFLAPATLTVDNAILVCNILLGKLNVRIYRGAFSFDFLGNLIDELKLWTKKEGKGSTIIKGSITLDILIDSLFTIKMNKN